MKYARIALWIIVIIAATVFNPPYAIVLLFMWGVVWAINKLIALHDKYLL